MTQLLRNHDFIRLIILANITLLLAGIYNLRISPGGLDMIDLPTLIALGIAVCGVLLSLVVALLIATWTLGRINTIHTERWARIEAMVESINSALNRFQSWLAKVDQKQDEHAVKIAKLEQHKKDNRK